MNVSLIASTNLPINMEPPWSLSILSLVVRPTVAPPCLNKGNLLLFFYFLTLQYCIGFAIYQNESATGIHVFPILNPPPSSFPIPSLWVIPVHQPQASTIVHRTWTDDSFHIWYYTYFNAISQIIPPSPSPTESKRLFYTSVSLLLSRKQGYRYHLSKF